MVDLALCGLKQHDTGSFMKVNSLINFDVCFYKSKEVKSNDVQ